MFVERNCEVGNGRPHQILLGPLLP